MECQHCSTCSWALIGHTMLHNISNHIKEVLCVLSETGINPFWSRGLMRICNYRRQASSLMFFVCVSYLRDFRLFTLDSGQYWKLVMVSPGSACNIPQLTDAQCQSNVFNISNKCIFKFEMEYGNNKWRYRAPHKQNTNNHQPHLNFQCVCVRIGIPRRGFCTSIECLELPLNLIRDKYCNAHDPFKRALSFVSVKSFGQKFSSELPLFFVCEMIFCGGKYAHIDLIAVAYKTCGSSHIVFTVS